MFSILNNKAKWVNKSTSTKVAPPKPQHYNQVLLKIWQFQRPDGWILARLQTRPCFTDPVVAFKCVVLLHRIHLKGPPDSIQIPGLPSFSRRMVCTWAGSDRSQPDPNTEVLRKFVTEYARLLELGLSTHRKWQNFFCGNWAIDRYLNMPNARIELSVDDQATSPIHLSVVHGLLLYIGRLLDLGERIIKQQVSPFFPLFVGALELISEECWSLLSVITHLIACIIYRCYPKRMPMDCFNANNPAALLYRTNVNFPPQAQRHLAGELMKLERHYLAYVKHFHFMHAGCLEFGPKYPQLLVPFVAPKINIVAHLFEDLPALINDREMKWAMSPNVQNVMIHISKLPLPRPPDTNIQVDIARGPESDDDDDEVPAQPIMNDPRNISNHEMMGNGPPPPVMQQPQIVPPPQQMPPQQPPQIMPAGPMVDPAVDDRNNQSIFPQQLEVDLNDVQIEKKVGSGATAQVYKALWRGTDVALKRLNVSVGATASKEFFRELGIMVRLRHPNLVLLMGASTRTRPLCVVTEYCSGGTLFELLHKHQAPITMQQKLKLALDIAKGCMYLHSSSPQIIHRDLKSLNILLVDPILSAGDIPCAKVSDFGLSKIRKELGMDRMTGMAGTYHWMAPEVLHNQPYNEKVDVYSYAIVLYEILSGTIPYSERSQAAPISIAMNVALGLRPDLTKMQADVPVSLRNLMKQCWTHSPLKRPNFSEILDVLREIGNEIAKTRR